VSVADVIIEVISPTDFLLVSRFGPHWVGIEYQVPDVDAARRVVLDRGIRIVRDIGGAFHTHPHDTFGVAFELFAGNFHDPSLWEAMGAGWIEPLRPLEYWRDEHPLGCTGLERVSIVVRDRDPAIACFTELLGAVPVYADVPRVASIATGLRLADTVVELLSPTGPGPVQDHLGRYGEGIRATVLRVADAARARSHLVGAGAVVEPGDAHDAFAISAADTCGVRFEFAEERQ
jgi:catechol 2,3-dioxygenase-like lactoylglutathione lyase family enzyme